MFLVVEGVEGSGKTTFAKRLAEELEKLGHEVVVTREPGGCALGESVREVFHDPNIDHISPDAEMMLIFASRVEHMRKTVIPALTEGKIVICDRHLATTYAYQVVDNGTHQDILFHEFFDHYRRLGLPLPDKTYFIDAPVDKLADRVKERSGGEELNRVERMLMEEESRLYTIAEGFDEYFREYEKGEVEYVTNERNLRSLGAQARKLARAVETRVRGTSFNYPSFLSLFVEGVADVAAKHFQGKGAVK